MELEVRLETGRAELCGGCVPRVRHAAHDGRGAAAFARGQGAAGERILERARVSPDACPMGRLLAARYHPARLLLSGGSSAAVLDCEPPRQGRNLSRDVRSCAV